MHSVSVVGGGGDASPSQHCACSAEPRFDSLCVGGRSLCHAWNTWPPAFPFQRVMRVLHQQQLQTSCVCFRFIPPLQPHVLPHLLVRCLQKCGKQAPARSAERFVRQLRCDGETAPAAAARRLSCSCLRCGLPRLLVTRCCADCCVLCVRCGGRADAVSVVEDG